MLTFLTGRYDKGFTLVEVLVAMSVTVLTIMSCQFAVMQSIEAQSRLKDKTLEIAEAKNVLNEYLITNEHLKTGKFSGVSDMGRHKLYWEVAIEKTPVKAMKKITVRAGRDERKKRTEIVGYALSDES